MVALKPLEFEDCLTDSPWFRQNLRDHETSLSNAYKSIKQIEVECQDLILAAKKLSEAHRTFARTLSEFKFDKVGQQTDEERVIAGCLQEFSRVITQVEDQRDAILEEAERVYIQPLRAFRCERIGKALNNDKKKFEKSSVKYYQSLDKHLHLSTGKGKHTDFREADASLEMERRFFYQASLDYVYTLQAVQERMRFEFVKTLSSFLYSWLSFYHVGHVIHEDFKPYLDLVQIKIEKSKESFAVAELEAEELKAKMLNVRTQQNATQPNCEPSTSTQAPSTSIRQGYLQVMEKKNIGPASWTKYYCVYQRESRIFTMIPYNQTAKMDMKGTFAQSISMKLKSCTRRASDTIDKRFCFDIHTDKDNNPITVQALSDDDRKAWLQALDGQEPVYSPGSGPAKQLETSLDNTGIDFITMCLRAVENYGLDEQGVYRNCGVGSKVQKLLQYGLDPVRQSQIDLSDDVEWEMRTITSAVKTYLRSLPEPVMTYDLHTKFINAAKMSDPAERVNHVHYYVYQLPGDRFRVLEIIMKHLQRVVAKSEVNLMTIGNLSVCFGPTLLRPKEETLQAIMDIKFCNVVVEVMLTNCEKIFSSRPPSTFAAPRPPKPEHSDQPCTDVRLPYKPNKQAKTRSVEQLNDTDQPYHNLGSAHVSRVVLRNQANSAARLRHGSPASLQGLPANNTTTTTTVMQTNGTAANNNNSRMFVPNNRQRVYSAQNAVPSTAGRGPVVARPINIYQEMQQANNPSDNSHPDQNHVINQPAQRANSNQPINGSYDSLASADSLLSQTITSIESPSPNQSINKSSAAKLGLSYAQPYSGEIWQKRLTGSTASLSHLHQTQSAAYLNAAALMQPSQRVRTLYDCIAGHATELSFSPGQIITNVFQSKEPGWLVGTLNGRTGLIPANYVEPLP